MSISGAGKEAKLQKRNPGPERKSADQRSDPRHPRLSAVTLVFAAYCRLPTAYCP
jgi:hypothetical protein